MTIDDRYGSARMFARDGQRLPVLTPVTENVCAGHPRGGRHWRRCLAGPCSFFIRVPRCDTVRALDLGGRSRRREHDIFFLCQNALFLRKVT